MPKIACAFKDGQPVAGTAVPEVCEEDEVGCSIVHCFALRAGFVLQLSKGIFNQRLTTSKSLGLDGPALAEMAFSITRFGSIGPVIKGSLGVVLF